MVVAKQDQGEGVSPLSNPHMLRRHPFYHNEEERLRAIEEKIAEHEERLELLGSECNKLPSQSTKR